MNDSRSHEHFRQDVAAYLLDALDRGDRATFESHLATCHICQEELERLSVAIEALPRSVDQFDAPPSLKKGLMEQVRAEASPSRPPRRLVIPHPAQWRWRASLAAAACAIVALIAVLASGPSHAPSASARSIAASVDTARLGPAHATVIVGPGGGGQVRVSSMPAPPRGEVYEIWVKRAGAIQPGPLFDVDQNGDGAGALPPDLDRATQVFVTRERRGGARQPTEAPVISARL